MVFLFLFSGLKGSVRNYKMLVVILRHVARKFSAGADYRLYMYIYVLGDCL